VEEVTKIGLNLGCFYCFLGGFTQ